MKISEEKFVDILELYLNKRKNASALVRDGDPFIEKTYDDFLKSDATDVRKWLESYLIDKFLYANNPPVWIGEQSWPYIDDEPMIFLHQFKLEKTENENTQFRNDLMYYFFGYNKKNTDKSGEVSFESIYKTVAQDLDSGNKVIIKSI